APGPLAFAHHRALQAVGAIDALVGEAVAVGDPALVDGLVVPRHHAHQAPAQHMAIEVGAEAVVRRHQRHLGHLPGARPVAERLAVERAHRTQIDDVARELVVDALLDIGADLVVLAAVGGAQFGNAGDLLAEPHTARAV